MQSVMNLKIKFRESFRPFAPVVLQDRASEYFEMKPGEESPYMLLVAPLQQSHRLPVSEEQSRLSGIESLKVRRSDIPAVTHVDWSARLQTLSEERNGRCWRLLKEFEARTGCPVMVNTSFNVRGEPIVCTPQDAFRCFLATDMDALILEDCVIHKEDVKQAAGEVAREANLAQFQLD